MTGELVAIGVSHRTAPVSFRERVAFAGERAEGLLADLVADPAIEEAVVLATCNRTELYLVAPDAAEAWRVAMHALAVRGGVSDAELRRHSFVLDGPAVARHLFAVAAGLDSVVVGEAQILGQVRRAHELALACGSGGPSSTRLFTDALRAGRRVRAQTDLGRSGASIASVAVSLARARLGELGSRRVVVAGAGRSGELTADALAKEGVAVVVLANRCPKRSAGLAARYGVAISLEDLTAELEHADAVITSTASPHQIITRDQVAAAMAVRQGRPLLLIDIAMPRDVDPAAGDVPGVTLVDLDGLQRRAAARLGERAAHASAAALSAAEAERFERWRAGRAAAPTIAALHGRAAAIVDEVLQANAPRWEGATEADRRRAEAMARAIAQRLLHEPTERLRQAAAEGEAGSLRAARELFGLEQHQPFPAP